MKIAAEDKLRRKDVTKPENLFSTIIETKVVNW